MVGARASEGMGHLGDRDGWTTGGGFITIPGAAADGNSRGPPGHRDILSVLRRERRDTIRPATISRSRMIRLTAPAAAAVAWARAPGRARSVKVTLVR